MNVTLRIPDPLAEGLVENGSLERQALEAFAVEAYRTESELRRLLGLATRVALDGFLRVRGVFEDYTLTDFNQDRETAQCFCP